MSAADWMVVAGFVLTVFGLWLTRYYGLQSAALLQKVCRRLGVEDSEQSDNRSADHRL